MNTPAAIETPSREEFIQRHLLFNLIAFLIDAGGWWLGMNFLSTQTILPYFVKQLGGSDLLVGVIPALGSLYQLPQLFVAPMTERRVLQRKAVLKIAFWERFFIGLMVPLALFVAKPAPKLALIGLFLLLGLNSLTMGLNMPGYATLFSKAIPANRRGRLWGLSGAIGGIIGMGGAWASARLLQAYGMPLGFAWCFLIGFLVLIVSVIPLGFIREPEAVLRPDSPTFRVFWRETRGLLKRNPGFLRLVCAEVVFTIPWIAPAFYTAYAKDHFNAGYAWLGPFTMMQTAASVVGGFAWGVQSDRHGNRRTLIYSAALMILAPLMALAVPSLFWFPGVFFIAGLAGSGFDLGLFNIVLEYGGEHKVATFQGLRGILVTPLKTLIPLLVGLLAGYYGYQCLFAVFAVAAMATLFLLRYVPDPRHHPVHRDQLDTLLPEAAGAEPTR